MLTPRMFRYFKTSPEIIRLAVMMYVRYPFSLRNVEDLLHERGIALSEENRLAGVECARVSWCHVKLPHFPLLQDFA